MTAAQLSWIAVALLGAAAGALVCSVHAAALSEEGGVLRRFPLNARSVLAVACGAAFGALCRLRFGASAEAAMWLLFLALLGAVALIDLDTMEIPDGLNIALAVLGVLSYFLCPGAGVLSRLAGSLSVSVPLTLIALIIPGAFGGGDIKLMAACGLWLGLRDTPLAAFLGILIGGVWGGYLLLTRKTKGGEHMPFGPCLCAGMALCVFLGDELAGLFLRIFDFSRFF